MSNKNKITWTVVTLLIAVTVIAAWANDDEILSFYTTRAAEVYSGRHPLDSGLSFSFKAKTYYKVMDDNSRYVLTDSAESIYYYSFGQQDSVKSTIMPRESFDTLPLLYPNIFDTSYLYNFFPNDTGSNELAIGFDTKTLDMTLPVGFAVIDRDRYFYRFLYLHYLDELRYKRWSRGYRFIEIEGMIVPDSIWTLKARRSFFSNEHYRYETALTDFVIYR